MKKVIDAIKNSESFRLQEELYNAGFEPDRFGQYHKEMPDGTRIAFYDSYFGWTVDVFTPEGKHLTEDDINVTELLTQYTGQ